MMAPWPKISIVSPSFNQGHYLEQAITSILGQDYPSLEYLVVDGGSADGSVGVIEKYAQRLSWWVSERDAGQSDALRKGFARSTGDLLGWVNSDDLLEPGALAAIGEAYHRSPGSIIAGNVLQFREGSARTRVLRQRCLTYEDMVKIWTRRAFYSQPGVFFPRAAYEAVGGVDVHLHYCMDHDLMNRMLKLCPVVYLDRVVARARLHPACKTCALGYRMVLESQVVSRRYWNGLPGANSRRFEVLIRLELLRATLGRIYHGAPRASLPLFASLFSFSDSESARAPGRDG